MSNTMTKLPPAEGLWSYTMPEGNVIHPEDCHRIFVFGSNLAGRHGKGAALHALKEYGAKPLSGFGHFGNSFAIPTKDESIKTLSLTTIAKFVASFIDYARDNVQLEFNVTRIGCGLAGHKDGDIAPFFAPLTTEEFQIHQVYFDPQWKPFLCTHARFWRTTNGNETS